MGDGDPIGGVAGCWQRWGQIEGRDVKICMKVARQ